MEICTYYVICDSLQAELEKRKQAYSWIIRYNIIFSIRRPISFLDPTKDYYIVIVKTRMLTQDKKKIFMWFSQLIKYVLFSMIIKVLWGGIFEVITMEFGMNVGLNGRRAPKLNNW